MVVVQHGRNGLRETIDRHVSYYSDFGSALADRGFIVFAPHNLYRGEDRYGGSVARPTRFAPRCSRSSSPSTSAFSTGSDRCPSSPPIALRSTV